MICPAFCYFIYGSTAAMPYSTPLMFTSISWFHSSILRRSSGEIGINPALLTMTSIRPYVRTAESTNLFAWSWRVTSVDTASALPPLLVNSSTSDRRRSPRRAPSTTLAPCAERSRAVDSPSPLLAPVMTTTFPSMLLLFMIILTSACRRRTKVLFIADLFHPIDGLAV
jgi:hypothetical protein